MINKTNGRRSDEKIEILLILIGEAEKANKISLSELEWTILPQFKVKLTLWTQGGIKEYEYLH